MYQINETLLRMKEDYQQALRAIEKQDMSQKLDGNKKLRVSTKNGRFYYYVCDSKESNTPLGGKYLHTDMVEEARVIAQSDYNEAMKSEIQIQLKAIDKAIKNIDYARVANMYMRLSDGRKVLVNQYLLSDEEYLKSWLNQEYTPKSFQEGTTEIFSDRGERVRSKSEKIIADKLYHLGIPYKYEAPLNIKGLGIIHPDFTIMDMKNRREVYWEHCGIMDNSEYAERAVARINQYERNGLHLGERLILTFETGLNPLDSRVLEQIIENYIPSTNT